MVSLAKCLSRSRELEAVSDSARLDTELLLAKALSKPRTFLYTWADKQLSAKETLLFTQWFQRRLNGEPIAYVLGEREFWSLSLAVNKSTIIPRPETELLVETALELLPESTQTVLDLGTGTGAIALALAKERPNWNIMAVDQSPAAVQLAIENCRKQGFKNVEITRSDWFFNVLGRQFNAIVCNPPYIDEDDKHLQQGDVRFEPKSALVAANKGFADIEKIIDQAPNFLQRQGWLLIEHGWQQGEKVRRLFETKKFKQVSTKNDLAGHERMTLGQREDSLSE